jgi:hypothetical protein
MLHCTQKRRIAQFHVFASSLLQVPTVLMPAGLSSWLCLVGMHILHKQLWQQG